MPTYERGDHVKVMFPAEDHKEAEWMWVKVDSSDDAARLVFGYDNVRDHRRFGERSELPSRTISELAGTPKFLVN